MSDIDRCLTRTALLIRRDFFPSLSETQIVAELTSIRIQLHADPEAVSTPAGQTALTSSAILIGQLGAEVAVNLPAVAPIGTQPPFPPAETLGESLLEGSRELIRPLILGIHEESDLVVRYGSSAPALGGFPVQVSLCAAEYGARLDTDPLAESTFRGGQPFGPLLAAIAVAAECFRLAVATIARRHGLDAGSEHYLGPPRPVSLAVPSLELGDQVSLGRLDVISAGAITNGLLFTLFRVPGIRGALRLFDADTVSLDNLNRCGLFTRADVDAKKVVALARRAPTELEISAEAVRFGDAELGPLAPRVVVGVDHIPSRWAVQKDAPGWLGVGGTTHFSAVVSEHDPDSPCAGCLHPEDDPTEGPVPTVSFVSALAGVLLAHRLLANLSGVPLSNPHWGWCLALFEERGLSRIGLAANPSCPVGCEASRSPEVQRQLTG